VADAGGPSDLPTRLLEEANGVAEPDAQLARAPRELK
jgi:hypothetical protein